MRRRRQVFETDLRRLQPLRVRVLRGELLFDLVVVDDAALFQVDQQHLAGLQAPLADDLLLGDRQHADFRGHDDEVIVGHDVARRAKAVAVKLGADDPSVAPVVRMATELSGPPQATLVGSSRRVDLVNAALVNGTAAHALDYDDVAIGAPATTSNKSCAVCIIETGGDNVTNS